MMPLAFEPKQSNPNLCSQTRLSPQDAGGQKEGRVWNRALPFTDQ